jgi:hypothetical protein
MLWSQDSPVNEGHDMWVGNGGSVEDAEEGTVLGHGVLTRGRQQLLHASNTGGDVAAVVRVMKMHPGPELYAALACTA